MMGAASLALEISTTVRVTATTPYGESPAVLDFRVVMGLSSLNSTGPATLRKASND